MTPSDGKALASSRPLVGDRIKPLSVAPSIMILTKCAACAAPLPHTSAKQCSRCKTRYCGPACQKQHWDGGHKDLCKRIKKGGGAEQYHADKKYKEAVAEAVEACAALARRRPNEQV